jgi:hypothetical protein
MGSILHVEPYIQKICDMIWMKFSDASLADTPLGLNMWTQYFAFDIVLQLPLGDVT